MNKWNDVKEIPIPFNTRMLACNDHEIAMVWRDVIDERLYYAPQGGFVPFSPTHWMNIPELAEDTHHDKESSPEKMHKDMQAFAQLLKDDPELVQEFFYTAGLITESGEWKMMFKSRTFRNA